jgi:hypothetical protein
VTRTIKSITIPNSKKKEEKYQQNILLTITATNTRQQAKKHGHNLLPHTIITYREKHVLDAESNLSLITTPSPDEAPTHRTTAPLFDRTPSPEPSSHITVNNNSNNNSMAEPTLLARARKARYDDLPNFSGHSSEDAERFLKSIKNISKATDDSTDPLLLEIVRGKLTQNAGSWFDDNESQFTKWSDFETTFRNRYFSTTIVSTKFDKLSQRKQQYDESVTTYYDDIITLCREVDSKMPDTIIIQHLMKGINPEFRKELTRRQTTISTLSEFLKIAKLEQDLHDTFTQVQDTTIQSEVHPMYHLSSQVNKMASHHNSKYRQQQSTSRDQNHHSTTNVPRGISTYKQPSSHVPETTSERHRQTQYRSCKVCGKQNHRSIDCNKKQSFGCYNCGKQHSVRDCTDPPHFQ